MNFSSLPKERLSRLVSIAQSLFSTGWHGVGNKGTAPHVTSLSTHNQRKFLAMAFWCEKMEAEAMNNAVQERAVVNNCIKLLEKYRDTEDHPIGR